jgi:hypothetical protein
VLQRLYRRSTKEVAFVRTGFLGEKVVIDGGAFVWPMIHEITLVNMNTLPLKVSRTANEALITKDRMRVDVDAEFYVRVQPERRAVAMAASTLGRRTLEPESLHALLAGKFESAMRGAAATMDMSGFIAMVDAVGNPVAPATNPNGTPFTGSLHYASVFGTVLNPTTVNPCMGGSNQCQVVQGRAGVRVIFAARLPV